MCKFIRTGFTQIFPFAKKINQSINTTGQFCQQAAQSLLGAVSNIEDCAVTDGNGKQKKRGGDLPSAEITPPYQDDQADGKDHEESGLVQKQEQGCCDSSLPGRM